MLHSHSTKLKPDLVNICVIMLKMTGLISLETPLGDLNQTRGSSTCSCGETTGVWQCLQIAPRLCPYLVLPQPQLGTTL